MRPIQPSPVKARVVVCFFFQAEDGIRDIGVTGVQTCALPILEWDVARKVKNTGAEVERYRKEAQGAVSGAWILMEFVQGSSVKDLLRGVDGYEIGRASCRERV